MVTMSFVLTKVLGLRPSGRLLERGDLDRSDILGGVGAGGAGGAGGPDTSTDKVS